MTTWVATFAYDEPKKITAEYWQVDPDVSWVFFKTSDHKVVYGCRSDRIVSVERAEPSPGIVNNGTITTTNIDELAENQRKATRRALGLAGI